MGVDHKVAVNWLIFRGKYTHPLWWIIELISSWIPALIILGFLAFTIFQHLLLLTALPLLIIAFLLQNPFESQKKISPTQARARTLFWLITNIAFLYFLLVHPSDWVWVFTAMIGIFISCWFIKKFALECFFTTATYHEDFFMEHYQKNIISLQFLKKSKPA